MASEELVRRGKTKDVYKLPNGLYRFQFKDDVTGHEDGKIDPGGNAVVGKVTGMGAACLRMTNYLFTKIAQAGIPTHFVEADLNAGTMTIKPAALFKEGVEVIVRYVATGSFVRRYGLYAKEGMQFPGGLVELTLKDDERGDPLITDDALSALGIMTFEQIRTVKEMALKAAGVVRDVLKADGLTLYDLKFEFGVVDGNVALIDEASPGSMRAYKGDKRVEGVELAGHFKD